MAATSTKAQSSFLKSMIGAVAVVALLAGSAGVSQAADSNDRIVPPSAADVAILRGLLALQHPALRSGSARVVPASAVPTVVTEPSERPGEPTSATEGEACVSPIDGSQIACTLGTESQPGSTAALKASFRTALERSMAAAGYAGPRL